MKKIKCNVAKRCLWAAVPALALCMMQSMPLFAGSEADEDSARTVRVAFPQQDGFSEIDTNGNYSGYTFEYMEKVAEYTGWDIEYITFDGMDVDESIVAAMEMVASGEADIVGGLLKNDVLKERYDFCDNSYGLVYTTLAALQNNISISEDNFREQSPLRVAVYDQAATRNAEVEEYLKGEGVSYELIPCDSVQKQMEALENKTADVVSNVSLSNFTGTKTVTSFAARPYYFATTKGNAQLARELDDALQQISYAFPYFESGLHTKYFGDNAGGFFLSAEQEQFLAGKQVLEVLCVADSAPYVMTDENGKPCGVLVSLMNDFAAATGLLINYDIYDRSIGFEEKLAEKNYDCILGIPVNQEFGTRYGYIRSTPLDTLDMVSFRRESLDKPLNECTVALVKESHFAEYLDCKELVYGDTVAECIRMVDEGRADIGYDNRSTVSYYMYDLFANMITDTQVGDHADICVTISKQSGNELLAILNNYIGDVTDDGLAEYYANANARNRKNMIELLARTNPFLAVLIISAIVIAMFVVVTLLVLNRRKKRQYELLAKATAAKSEFLSHMSHDMRTPMNAIIGFADIGIDGQEGEDPMECLHNIKTAGNYLLGLINDVLDMSKIEEGKVKLNPEPYYYAEFEAAIRNILIPKAQKKGVEFIMHNEVPMPNALELDKLRMQQIFVNLIGNAIKFTPEGGRVELIVSAQKPTIDGKLPLMFVIRDNGIGMSEEFLKNKLYHAFEQEQNSLGQNEAGTGLGLSIAKQLVEQMGGEIACVSKLQKGTTFTVKIYPVIVAASHEDKKEDTVDIHILKGKRVLLCEDHPLNVQIATKLLQHQQMEVVAAENGSVGIEILKEHEAGYFDAILMDIRMPVMDGLEAARVIRSLEREDAQTIPIIAMTANAYAEDVQKSREAGMNAHLAKPIEPDKLFQCLAVYLNRKGES